MPHVRQAAKAIAEQLRLAEQRRKQEEAKAGGGGEGHKVEAPGGRQRQAAAHGARLERAV